MRILVISFAAILTACSGEAPAPPPDPAPAVAVGAASPAPSTAPGGGTMDHSGGGDARNVPANPTPGAFGATCASGTDCESNVCFVGGHGGSCSLQCTSDAECPSGASGAAPHCNPRGYCRY